jgi:hypothetical protein
VILALAAGPGWAELNCVTEGNVTSCEQPGNLAPTQDRGCIRLDEADTGMSPADLSLSVVTCGHEGRYEDAAQLYLLVMARGAFDTRRVADTTAHQAISVLQFQIFNAMNQAQNMGIDTAVQAQVADMAAFCAVLSSMGPPEYDPGYMIAHGMCAVLDTGRPDLVDGFDAEAAWGEVLRTAMTCAA